MIEAPMAASTLSPTRRTSGNRNLSVDGDSFLFSGTAGLLPHVCCFGLVLFYKNGPSINEQKGDNLKY